MFTREIPANGIWLRDVPGNTNLYSSAIQYVIFLVTTGVMLPIIDRVGRRQLLLGGAVTCMTLHFATAGVMATYGRPVPEVFGNANLRLELDPTPGKAVIALSYIFTGIYGLTWAPTGWIYCSEVFPLKYRAKGVGLSAATNWYVSSSPPPSSSSSLPSVYQIPIYTPMLTTM